MSFGGEKLSKIYTMICRKLEKWSDLASSRNKGKGKSKKAATFVKILNNS